MQPGLSGDLIRIIARVFFASLIVNLPNCSRLFKQISTDKSINLLIGLRLALACSRCQWEERNDGRTDECE